MASLGGAATIRTLSQAASISSATINGSDVFDPWPISLAGDIMEIVPSADIVTQGLSVADSAALAVVLKSTSRGETKPYATPKLRPAAPIMTCRRFKFWERRGGL